MASASAQIRGGAPPEPIGCPDQVTATALPDGSVRVAWSAVPEADFHQVVATGPDDVRVLTTADISLIDDGTAPGKTYTYSVIPSTEEPFFVAGDCPDAQVTAVPFFTQGGATVAAAVMGAVAWAVAARRT